MSRRSADSFQALPAQPNCGSAELVVGVVDTWTPLSPSPRRAQVRRNIRETWKNLGNKDTFTVFVIGLNRSKDNALILPSEHLADEARNHNDMLFVETNKVRVH